MSSWPPLLRLAMRDARRHLARTVLAALLIAVPITGFAGFVALSNPGVPPRDRALSSIPHGAQAIITATAIPRGGPPFEQVPEGPPGPWMDDFETVPANGNEIAALLSPGTELAEFWHSPPLAISPDLQIAPGEKHHASDAEGRLEGIRIEKLAMVKLHEAEPAAFELFAPDAAEGNSPSNPEELLVSRRLASRLGVAPGDTVAFVSPPDRGVRSTDGTAAAALDTSVNGYVVTGIAEVPGYSAWAQSGWLSELVEENHEGVQRHWLALGEDPLTWQQTKALNELQAFAVSRHVLENYPSSAELYPIRLSARTYLEAAIGVTLMLVIGSMLVLFLVTPALAISAEQSRRTLGLAAAAGATPVDLRRTILAQGVVIGVLGGLLGAVLSLTAVLGVGAWLGALEKRSGVEIEQGGVDTAFASFPWWTLAVGGLMALTLGLTAALGPALSASRLSPVDALRDRPTTQAQNRKKASLLVGPGLVVLSLLLGSVTLLAPLPGYPPDADVTMGFTPGTPPPGSGWFTLLVGLSVVGAAVGLVFTIHTLLPRIGGLGRRSGPVWRLALRDAADHPSRTVPAVLGVTFSLLASSYFLVLGASSNANDRATYATLDWRGTFFITPEVPISPEFDRALATSVLDEITDEIPQITGSHPFEVISTDSSTQIVTLPPVGQSCPADEEVHASSARELGAPLRCVSGFSDAQFRGGIRIGSPFSTWDEPLLIDGEMLIATRVPGAEAGAELLDRGGVLVSDASLIDADGMVRLSISGSDPSGDSRTEPNREVGLPGMLLRGVGVGFIMSPGTARELGVDELDFAGLAVDTSEPVDIRTLNTLWQRDVGGLVMFQIPDGQGPLGNSADPADTLIYWSPVILLVLVAITATSTSVMLSATQGRRDAATAHAVGADRRMLRRLGLARAMVILVGGVPTGIGAGMALGAYQVAWNRRLEASGAWLDTVPVWGAQIWIALSVVPAGLFAALILSRPPRMLVRRSLD